MNHKDNANLGITSPPESRTLTQPELLSHTCGTTDLKQFVDCYCSPIYSAIARLAGLTDPTKLEILTGNVLLNVWNHKNGLSKEEIPGVFIYTILLQQVFGYLKKEGNEDRIRILRNILLVNPACYLHILEPQKKSLTSITQTFLLHKIKQIWKTF